MNEQNGHVIELVIITHVTIRIQIIVVVVVVVVVIIAHETV